MPGNKKLIFPAACTFFLSSFVFPFALRIFSNALEAKASNEQKKYNSFNHKTLNLKVRVVLSHFLYLLCVLFAMRIRPCAVVKRKCQRKHQREYYSFFHFSMILFS